MEGSQRIPHLHVVLWQGVSCGEAVEARPGDGVGRLRGSRVRAAADGWPTHDYGNVLTPQ